DSLQRLEIDVQVDFAGASAVVEGCAGRIPVGEANLFTANSGTTIRFLTAMTAIGAGTFRLDGVERMRERPIRDLLDALRQLGAEAVSEAGNGCPPVILHADGLRGGAARVRGDVSSQFLSVLLMAAPYAQEPVRLEIDGPLVSRPYVDITLSV